MKHLSPLDVQLLLEGEATPPSVQHLEVCVLCQEEFRAELRAEAALWALGKNAVALSTGRLRDAARSTARPVEPECAQWEDVSAIRAVGITQLGQSVPSAPTLGRRLGAGGSQLRSSVRRTLAHSFLIAACVPLPWFNFIAQPPQPETALTSLQISRCLNSQPWCR
jgi:hypothetical protein